VRFLARVVITMALACGSVAVVAVSPSPAQPIEGDDCSGYPCPMSFDDLDAWRAGTVDPRQRPSVPLAPRSGPTPTPKVVAGLDFTDFNYDPEADGSTQGGSIDNLYAFGHWQQVDVAYFFHHSLVNVPPVVWTNAAHRNGVPILGAVGSDFPGGSEAFRSLFTPDHLQRTIDQLAAMADAYEFDGWIFDPESAEMVSPQMVQAIAALEAKGLVVGYYQAHVCELSTATAETTRAAAAAATFWQGDYPCLDDTEQQAKVTYDYLTGQLGGLDRWDAYNASNLYASERDPRHCKPPLVTNGVACDDLGSLTQRSDRTFFGALALDASSTAPGGFWGSLAVFAPGWPAYGGSHGFPVEAPVDVWRPLDDRIWNGTHPPTGPDCSTATSDGLARWAPPRPPVATLPFTTTFNRGFSGSFSVQGTPVPTEGWNHIGMEDAQPSWLCRTMGGAHELAIAVEDGPAWNGGSALRVQGELHRNHAAEWAVLAAAASLSGTPGDPPVARVRLQGTGATPYLSLWFGDGPPERLRLDPAEADASGWATAEVDLRAFAGRTLTRVGFLVGNEGPDTAAVDWRIGELTLARESQLDPLAPIEVGAGASPTITWAQPAGAVSADVWARTAGGCAAYLGPAYVPVYDTAEALFPAPDGAVVTGYLVQPVTAAGTAAPLGAQPCGGGQLVVDVFPPTSLPPVDPPAAGPPVTAPPGPGGIVAPRFTG
jgi:endo-beta-N-acetylglucosaminidase D